MKILVDIKDSKADFVLELLRNFPYVKTEQISKKKELFFKEFQVSINEVNLAELGKIKLKSAEQLLNEL
jgi:hypothetical protein